MAGIQDGGREMRNLRMSRVMKWRLSIACLLLLYSLITIYTVNKLLSRRKEGKHHNYAWNGRDVRYNYSLLRRPAKTIDVEIWGKAAIGLYLWEHVLQGTKEDRLGGVWSYGQKDIGSIRFKFRTGPGVVPGKVPKKTENLVLILNGREPKKVDFARVWLDSLENLLSLRNVAVVLLGNEACDNDWFLSYMQNRGGPVKISFIVYDIPNRDDDTIFQWPLGVATYRKFNNIPPLSIEVEKPRKYICNFLGTMYNDSSRVMLKKVLDVYRFRENGICYIQYRQSWLPNESGSSKQQYYYALSNSDLTLSPVGVNSECYRIYEACSYGSVPVIEDVMTPGKCGHSGGDSPLHILKKYKAPFIFIKDWTELPKIIEREQLMSTYELADRRKAILSWYNKFKEQLRLHFVDILSKKFV